MTPSTATIAEAIQHLLHEAEDLVLPVETLLQTPWAETGLTSLALMQMVLDLEQRYGCDVSNEALRSVQTFGDLATVLQEACARL